MEERSSLLGDFLAIGAGIILGFVILDLLKPKENSSEDGEYIVTSTGRKIYVEIVDAVSKTKS
jgi:hypothetical protein